MNQHSIIEHRANYYFITLQDDYLAMYEQLNEKIQAKIDHDKDIKGSDYKGKNAPAPSDCKAMITSVLEHWMNSLRIKSKNDNDLWMNFTYEEWEGQLRGCYKRSTIIQCLQEMQEDRDEDGDRVIKTRPYKQNIHSYQLNIPVIQKLLNDLPAQSPYGSKPRPKLGRPSKICSQKNGFKTDGISVNPSENKYNLKTDGLTIKPSENKPINDKYRLKTNDEPSENKRYFHDETSSQAVSSAPIDYIQITNTYISNTQIKEESVRPPTSTPQPSLEEVSSSETHTLFEEEKPAETKPTPHSEEEMPAPKPRKPKTDPDTTTEKPAKVTREQIKKAYEVISKVKAELYTDPEYIEVENERSTKAIIELVKAKGTPTLLALVLKDMWNERGDDGTYWWRQNRKRMSVSAICSQYANRASDIKQKMARQQPAQQTTTTQTPTVSSVPGIGDNSCRPELKRYVPDMPLPTTQWRNPNKRTPRFAIAQGGDC